MLNKGYIIQKENHQGNIELETYFRINGSNVYIYIYLTFNLTASEGILLKYS